MYGFTRWGLHACQELADVWLDAFGSVSQETGDIRSCEEGSGFRLGSVCQETRDVRSFEEPGDAWVYEHGFVGCPAAP
jgi:hypothetical protein